MSLVGLIKPIKLIKLNELIKPIKLIKLIKKYLPWDFFRKKIR